MSRKKVLRGQSLLEFSIILPTAFFLITGFLDMGRAVFYYSSLTNAVREATRYAIVHRDDVSAAFNNPADNPLQDKVLEYAFALTGPHNPLEKSDVTVNVQKDGIYFATVSIAADYTFDPITPGINILLGPSGGIDLHAQSKMYVVPGTK